MTTRPHLDIFSESQLSGLWELIVEYFVWISSVLGVIAFIGWVAGFRPRPRRISQTSYIDCESDHIFEEIDFRISWGYVFFLRKIKFPPIERNATFKVLCKPLGGIKDELHMDNYIEKTSRSSRIIYLVNKDFFKNNEIEEIFIETTRPLPPDYRDKVKIRRTSKRIEVLNWNHIEVRGFPVKLPKTITLVKILTYTPFFNRWITPNDARKGITAILKPIPPCKGGDPGKVTIPLS